MKWVSFLCALSLAWGHGLGTALASDSSKHTLPPDWDDFVQQGMAAWQVPGVAIAVVKEGEVLQARGYGVQKKDGAAIDEETLFAIGSTTKAFTTAALGLMVDEGKTTWDAPVHKINPDVQFSDPWVTQQIKVSDLLSNRSGLSGVSEMLWYGTDKTRAQILTALAHIPFEESFRYDFQYRNVMFLLAGQLLPHLSGQSWEEIIRTRFFAPLGMKRSFATEKGIEKMDNVAQPHVINYEGEPLAIPYRPMENIAPAGSIISCVQDLIPWMLLHLQDGQWQEDQILQPQTMAMLHRSQTPLSTTGPAGDPLFPPAELRSYALGWVTESYRGHRLVWHNGGIDGMSAWIGLVPDLGLGVAVLSNLDNCDLRVALFYRLIDYFAGNEPLDLLTPLVKTHRENLAARDEAEADWQKLQANPPQPELPLAQYAGTFSHPAFGRVEVKEENGALVYERTPSQTLDLLPKGENEFLGRFRNEAEDLRSGKVDLVFAVEDGVVTDLTEADLLVFDRVNH